MVTLRVPKSSAAFHAVDLQANTCHHRQQHPQRLLLIIIVLTAFAAAVTLSNLNGFQQHVQPSHLPADLKALVFAKRTLSLLVVHPGFGEPHLESKLDILRRNIGTIMGNNAPWKEVTFLIFCYSVDAVIPEHLKGELASGVFVKWIQRKGVIMEYLHFDVPPSVVGQYDYVLTLVDDVELTFDPKPNQPPMDWHKMLQLQERTQVDILACCLGAPYMTAWPYMVQQPLPHPVVREQQRAEWFCYFMKPAAYTRYYEFVDPRNSWSWGMDFIVTTHMHLRVGVVNSFVGNHHFRGGGSGDNVALHAMWKYLAKYNVSGLEQVQDIKLKNAAKLYFDGDFPKVLPLPINGTEDLKTSLKDPYFIYQVGNTHSNLGNVASAFTYWLQCLDMVLSTPSPAGIILPQREVAYMAATNIASYIENFLNLQYNLTNISAKELSKFLNKDIPFENSSTGFGAGNNGRHINVLANISNSVSAEVPTWRIVAKAYYQAHKILPYRKEALYHIARLLRTYANDHEACMDAVLVASIYGPHTNQTLESNENIVNYDIDNELCLCGHFVENSQRAALAMKEGMSACTRLASLLSSQLDVGGEGHMKWRQSIEAAIVIYVAKQDAMNQAAAAEEERKKEMALVVSPAVDFTAAAVDTRPSTNDGGQASNRRKENIPRMKVGDTKDGIKNKKKKKSRSSSGNG